MDLELRIALASSQTLKACWSVGGVAMMYPFDVSIGQTFHAVREGLQQGRTARNTAMALRLHGVCSSGELVVLHKSMEEGCSH